MKVLLRSGLLFLALSLSLVACKPDTTADSDVETQKVPPSEAPVNPQMTEIEAEKQAKGNETQTIVKQIDGLQVSFDISTMQAHHSMMDAMGMKMKHSDQSSHYVLVTVMDAQKKIIKDLPIKIKVIDPTNKSLGDPAGENLETMSGKGMYHYGHGFNFTRPGKYQILVVFEHGGQVLSTGTEWVKS